jgi:predicted nucleotidyltransferase
MNRNPEQILKIIEANREKIKGFGVRRLGLFGSAARGEATEASDLDFLVELEKKTFDNYMDLKEFLEELFGCKVDLVMKDAIKPLLREPILREAIYAQGL